VTTYPVEKTLRPGEARFVARSRVTGRHTTWNVYDRARACYPCVVAGYGRVPEGMATEAEAQAVAERLEQFYARRQTRA
jgi:hypothetical protein